MAGYDNLIAWMNSLPLLEDSSCEQYAPIVTTNPHMIHAADNARIDSFVKIEGGNGVAIGHLAHIASFAHIGIGGGTTILEDFTSFASGSKVISGSNIHGLGFGCSAIDPKGSKAKYITLIKRNAVMFVNAVVLPGLTIGENAVICAGALVRHNVPDREIWAGVPAVKIGEVS